MSNTEQGRQARLPKALEGPTIAAMEFRRVYYTTSWAMWADEERRLWLHPDFDALDAPGGTVNMAVELREDGYHVWPPPGAVYRASPGNGYYGRTSQPFIPVAEVHLPGEGL